MGRSAVFFDGAYMEFLIREEFSEMREVSNYPAGKRFQKKVDSFFDRKKAMGK